MDTSSISPLRRIAFTRYRESFSSGGIAKTEEARKLSLLAYQRTVDLLANNQRNIEIEGISTDVKVKIVGSIAEGTSQRIGICRPRLDLVERHKLAADEHAHAAAAEFGHSYTKGQYTGHLPSDLDVTLIAPLWEISNKIGGQAWFSLAISRVMETMTPFLEETRETAYAKFGVYIEFIGWNFYEYSADIAATETTAGRLANSGVLRLFGAELSECEALLKYKCTLRQKQSLRIK